MKKLFLAAQLLTALIFIVFGANGLIYMATGNLLIPLPPKTESMGAFMASLFAAKYLMPTVKIIEVFAGALLLVNKFSNLALILLGPLVFNILFVHIFLDPPGILVGVIVTVLYSMCIFARWKSFKNFLFN